MQKPATCTLCEAACGILVDVDASGEVTAVRGDPDDPISRGYVCPKVVGMQDLHEDPDRLRTPLVRRANGGFREASWEEALDVAARGLRRVRRAHGNDALAVYQGNPTAHNVGLMTFGQAFLRTFGTKNLYSASSADQVPHMLASHECFGHLFLMPVPDVDRTDYFLVLGANPAVSNGSIMTAPDMKRRLAEIRARGKVVVVDPRRTETAALASEHVFVRPGSDPLFLLSLLHVIFDEKLARPGTLTRHLSGLDELREACLGFSPASVAELTGVSERDARRIAREFARADRAVCYGRIGVCQQKHGTVAAWLVYALNAVTGNLDREGGMMWTTPALDPAPIADLVGLTGYDRFKSRVRSAPEVGGELPIACLAEEIETPGPGQVRALLTSAGNPALSAPNGARLERAFGKLDHLVCIDAYLNETTRHAHVILPPVSPLQRPHYDVALNAFAVRNQAKWVDAPLPRGPNERHDWEIVLDLALRVHLGEGPVGRSATAALARAGRALGVEGLIDLGLRTLTHREDRLTLARVRAQRHGLDLGPLEGRLPALLKTRDKKVHLAPRRLIAELPALRSSVASDGLVLIGRRHLRSNNSWLHNSARLVKGRNRCTLQIHPRDAAAQGVSHGGLAEVETRAGCITLEVEVTEDVMPGVVSIPHGFGHDRAGTRTSVASEHAGVSVNDITDDAEIDRLSGNAAFSGLPVRVRAAAATSRVTAAE